MAGLQLLTRCGLPGCREVGGKALAALLLSRHEAIVLDVLMPEPGGLEVCRAIRAPGDDTPILVLPRETWCDMRGCGASFADPAALGETDNRARAACAGWARDQVGRLICPACQQRDHQASSAARLGQMSPDVHEALPSVPRVPELVDGFRRDTSDDGQAKPVARPPEPIPAAIA